jgi:hypothetical protein
MSDDRKTADHDHIVVPRQLLDELSCRGAHFSTVSLTLQAISQNSATDEGLSIQGSLLSVMRQGGNGALRRRMI